jgi:hypothetical protein
LIEQIKWLTRTTPCYAPLLVWQTTAKKGLCKLISIASTTDHPKLAFKKNCKLCKTTLSATERPTGLEPY